MAFTIWYNSVDLQALEDALLDPSLAGAQRTLATRVNDNGFSGWRTATPLSAADSLHCNGDPDVRQITITNPQVSLADFRAWLDARAVATNRPILRAIAKDLGGASGGAEV